MRKRFRRRLFNQPVRLSATVTSSGRLRRGLTLLEVVLSIAIFAMSLTAIYRLVSTGSNAAIKANAQTDAMIRCETRLAEIISGQLPTYSTSETVFADDPAWSWQLLVEDDPSLQSADGNKISADGLKKVSMTVRRRNRLDDVVATATLDRLIVAGTGGSE